MGRYTNLSLIGMILSAPAVAQSGESAGSTSTTLIYGTVMPVCSVEAARTSVQVELTLGQQDVTALTYTCNDMDGFTRRISSGNGGSLARNGSRIAYRLSQGGSNEIRFSNIDLTTPSQNVVSFYPELTSGSSGILRIELPSIPPQLLAGDYSDIVTIEITPN